jgi:hypothetical protein
MEKPAPHRPQKHHPACPQPHLNDLPPQQRQEALNVLVAMLLNHHRQRQVPDDRRR